MVWVRFGVTVWFGAGCCDVLVAWLCVWRMVVVGGLCGLRFGFLGNSVLYGLE